MSVYGILRNCVMAALEAGTVSAEQAERLDAWLELQEKLSEMTPR